ncbi:MAG: BamA/TamA family outer membrane protein, partial [Candidatus Marinimicrobia bacterium]|nr:BamA/TamA family outer membrane protein [Candidatus Neomarinimicrobiota bacterium]
NERYTIKQISVEGNTLLTDGEILELLGVKVGEPFRQYVYYSNFKKILAKYSELGHPFAGIREEYDWGMDLEITLYINEDISYDVNKITIDGNKTVGEIYIRKHFNIKKGKPYQLEKINQTKDRIYEMGAFNSVNIVPVNPDTSTQTLDLDVSVIESKARRFDVRFGARQGYTEKISYSSLFLEPEWTHKNLFHRAHRFRIGFTYDALIQNKNIDHLINAEIGYTVPWLVFLRLPTTFKIYYDRNTYSPFDDIVREDTLQKGEIRTDYGMNLSSVWRYNRNIYTRFSVSLRNLKSELNGISDGFELQTEISLQSRFDNRDNFIYPTKGWNILLYGGYVLGTDKETETEYFRFESSVNAYARLARNLVLAARLEAGQFFDMETIDPLMIYQLGSETTVRGWVKSIGKEYEIISEDSTSNSTIYAGKAKILGNIELRIDLVWNFGIDVFVDAGRLEDDLSNILDWSGYFMNTGIGIYYKTPIGPVRVEFPFILNDPSGNENEFTFNRISFGLLFAF